MKSVAAALRTFSHLDCRSALLATTRALRAVKDAHGPPSPTPRGLWRPRLLLSHSRLASVDDCLHHLLLALAH